MHRLWRTLSLAALALAGIAHPAWAADKSPVAAPAPIVNWTGFYVGGDVGSDFASTRFKQPMSGLSDTSVGSIDHKTALSVYGGFNYQVLPWAVLGVEGEKTWLNAGYRELGPSLDFLQQSTYVASVAGRAGFLLRPDTMIYGKLGPAWIDVRGFQGFGDTFARSLAGMQAAFGIETLVTPNVALRAEGSYTRADQVLSLNQGFDRYRPTFLLFRVGAEYKFDAPGGWGAQSAALGEAAAATTPAPTWTGFEVGGFASLNGNHMTYYDTLGGALGPFSNLVLGGGGFVGANYDYKGRLVVGVEASGNFDKANFFTAAGSGGLLGTFYNFAAIDNVFAVTARGGWLASPNTLLYVKGGPAWIRMSTNYDYWNNIAPNATGSRTFSGYQLGVGVETFVTSNVSVRLEGLYTRVDGNVVLNGTITPGEFTLQPSIMAATTGVALHF
jgi:outer membrane immunogenic protein